MAFIFKQFSVNDDSSTMKVGTDAVLLGAWANVDNISTILDIGTGCGVIALMLAQRSKALIDAVDIDLSSAQQAKCNFDNSIWSERLLAHHSSLQNFIINNDKHFNLIVSNPPYFNNSLKSDNSKRNLARHTESLPFGELARDVSQVLNKKGKFCIILPVSESNLFNEIANDYSLYCSKKIYILPKRNVNSNRIISEFTFTKHSLQSSSLVIHNNDDSYTDEYIKLTKQFYLNF